MQYYASRSAVRPVRAPCVVVYREGLKTVVDFCLGPGRISGHVNVVDAFLHAEEEALLTTATVFDRATLRTAFDTPDEYPNLIIRVGGFPLNKAKQDIYQM